MPTVPFTKLHGAENDFLLTWADQAPTEKLETIAQRICARNTGIGGDGWMLIRTEDGKLHTRLFNSDGSEPEISGNGTRCAAAFGLLTKTVAGPEVTVVTGAGAKTLRLLHRDERRFEFEMDMGVPVWTQDDLRSTLQVEGESLDVAILNVGNPQCAVFVEHLPTNWQQIGRAIEHHPRFPNRTNVSFVLARERRRIEVYFYERGAGETKSSGTGSTGAGLAAILRGMVESPLEISTPAGPLRLRWDSSAVLTGPCELIGEGVFFLDL